jgi:hypothetical protein
MIPQSGKVAEKFSQFPLGRLEPYINEYSPVSSNSAIDKIIIITTALMTIIFIIPNSAVVVVVWLSLLCVVAV